MIFLSLNSANNKNSVPHLSWKVAKIVDGWDHQCSWLHAEDIFHVLGSGFGWLLSVLVHYVLYKLHPSPYLTSMCFSESPTSVKMLLLFYFLLIGFHLLKAFSCWSSKTEYAQLQEPRPRHYRYVWLHPSFLPGSNPLQFQATFLFRSRSQQSAPFQYLVSTVFLVVSSTETCTLSTVFFGLVEIENAFLWFLWFLWLFMKRKSVVRVHVDVVEHFALEGRLWTWKCSSS